MKTTHYSRMLSILLVFAVIVTIIPFGVFTVNATTSEFAGGSGSVDDPYLIETKYHLNNVRKHLNAHYKVIDDIVFNEADFKNKGSFYNGGKGWTPIGSSPTDSFRGTFDGNNKSIKGLHINISSSNVVYAGLFGCCDGGNITNLTVDSGHVDVSGTTKVYSGGVCAYSVDTSFDNCYNFNDLQIIVHADSTGVEPYSYVGGISGYGGNYTECENRGSIITEVKVYNDDYDYAYCGGIVGGDPGEISNSANFGNISATSTSTWTAANIYSGGIAGNSSKKISNCKNYGNISSSANNMTCVYAGGICGSFSGESLEISYNNGTVISPHAGGVSGTLRHGTIANCYNLGEIISSDYAGGIVGYVTYNGEIENCYNVGLIRGSDNSFRIGGITGYMSNGISTNCYFIDNVSSGTGRGSGVANKCDAEKLKNKRTYTGFDFKNVWKFAEGNAYPYPTLQSLDYFVIDENYYYSIVFEDEDGTILSERLYHYGDIVVIPDAPTKPSDLEYNYSFVGWDSTVVPVTQSITYTALYEQIPVEIESIEVISKPNKLLYLVMDSFDSTGLIVVANYNNGKTTEITDYTVSGYNSTPGTQTITVTYEGKSAMFEVTVLSSVPTEITSEKYTIDNGYISRILASTTVKDFVSEFNEGYFCKVYKDGIEVSEDSVIESGMTVSIVYNDDIIVSYKVAVTADINGDGAVNAVDSNLLKRIIAGTLTYDDMTATMFAADVNDDGTVNAVDSNLLKRVIAGTYIIPT